MCVYLSQHKYIQILLNHRLCQKEEPGKKRNKKSKKKPTTSQSESERKVEQYTHTMSQVFD